MSSADAQRPCESANAPAQISVFSGKSARNSDNKIGWPVANDPMPTDMDETRQHRHHLRSCKHRLGRAVQELTTKRKLMLCLCSVLAKRYDATSQQENVQRSGLNTWSQQRKQVQNTRPNGPKPSRILHPVSSNWSSRRGRQKTRVGGEGD